jgi:hypothetical protein
MYDVTLFTILDGIAWSQISDPFASVSTGTRIAGRLRRTIFNFAKLKSSPFLVVIFRPYNVHGDT